MGVFIPKITLYDERRLEEKKLPNFGHLQKMAMAAKGSIDVLLASRFCERTNYVATTTITKGNLILGIAEVNMLVILIMNRVFLLFIQNHYRKKVT